MEVHRVIEAAELLEHQQSFPEPNQVVSVCQPVVT